MGNIIDKVGLRRVLLTKVITASSVSSRGRDDIAERYLLTAAMSASKAAERRR